MGTYRGYLLRKFVESAFAGALVVSDMPCQDEAFWRQVVVALPTDASEDEIARTVRWWLAHDAERLAWVTRAQRLVSAKYSYQAVARLMLEEAEMYRAGARGMFCPYTFTVPTT